MRLRYDQKAVDRLKDSKYLLKNFPFKLDENMVIELGMGKGEMITQLASMNPGTVYIGVEKYDTVAYQAHKKAEQLNLNNFFILCEDIKDLHNFLEGKVKTIWLTFSDPWPKARHAKKRLTYKTYLEIYKKLLTEDGVLRFKTDNDGLFASALESLEEFGATIKFKTNDLHNSPEISDNVKTGYEIKWSERGKNINYLEAKL